MGRNPERQVLQTLQSDPSPFSSGISRYLDFATAQTKPKIYFPIATCIYLKKHVKPNPMKGTNGGIVEKAMPIHQSNVAIFNAATGKADRVGAKQLADGNKVRVYKSSGDEIQA